MDTCTRCGTPHGTHVYRDRGRRVCYCVHCRPERAERVTDDWRTVKGSTEP